MQHHFNLMLLNKFCGTLKTIAIIFDILYYYLITFIFKLNIKMIHVLYIE